MTIVIIYNSAIPLAVGTIPLVVGKVDVGVKGDKGGQVAPFGVGVIAPFNLYICTPSYWFD